MPKYAFITAKQKNECIEAIIQELVARSCFLIVGHKNPDEDCIASMTAFGLLAKKFDKEVSIYASQPFSDNFSYLVDIARYNQINIISRIPRYLQVDVIVICDTPKPSMMDVNATIKRLLHDDGIRKIEIDHHLGADSEYIGDRGYCLVTEASSASELVGHIALKLRAKRDILKRYVILDPLSRNVVLAILTGIIGDSQMGKFLKSSREKRFYRIFSTLFNQLLRTATIKETNITDMNQIFEQIKKISETERRCIEYISQRAKKYKSIGYVILTERDMQYLYAHFDAEEIVNTTRTIADMLAEESGKIGLVAYWDLEEKTNLVQFRMRRSHHYKEYDLRDFLVTMNIDNGGGHEGAIGFRIQKKMVSDFNKYVDSLIRTLDSLLP